MAIDQVRWQTFLWPPLFISFLLFVVPQAAFIWMSFHEDLGMGVVSEEISLENYVRIVTDPFYLGAFWLTTWLSALATLIAVVVAFPTAYVLTRTPHWLASLLLGLILVTSLVTVVIKLMGLTLILGASGMVNSALIWLNLIAGPLQLINNEFGVLIGLLHYTLPLLVLLLFSVLQTIPENLEEAAVIHGASRASVYWWIILPLAKPGLVSGALIVFNMCMGAFTSAVLLGGGRVRTIPVMIQQEIILGTKYAMGSALSTSLLLFVFAINLVIGAWLMRQGRSARGAGP